MSEFEKYIADKNSVWGKRRNNQGGRQLDPTEIAEMLNELERVKQERDVATKSAERLAANCELLESQRNLAESERRVLQYKLADANEGRAQAESECDAAQQSRARLVGAIRRWREIDRAFEKRSLMQVLDENKTLRAKLNVLTEERNLLLNAVQGQMESDLRVWQEALKAANKIKGDDGYLAAEIEKYEQEDDPALDYTHE